MSLTRMLERSAAAAPHAAALIEHDVDAGEVRRLSFGELRQAVQRLAPRLAERGVARGDVVAVWLPNWTDAVVWQFTLASLGAAALGVNTRYHVHEMAHLLRRARPSCVAVPFAFLDLELTDRLRRAVAEVAADDDPPPVPQVAVARAPEHADLAGFDAGAGTWAATLSGPPAPSRSEGGRAFDTACVFTTSGSTSAPKLACHDQGSVARHSGNVARAFDVRAGDAVLCVLPLSGVFGFTPAMAALAAGASCVLTPVFRPGAALQAMHDHGITHLVGGDDMFGRLKDAWDANPLALPAWRRGGMAEFVGRTDEVLQWAEQAAGASISGVYGSSELFALTAIWEPDVPISQRAVGGGHLVAADIGLRVVDRETGRPLEPGETGELQFRGYNVLSGYLGDPAATAAAFTADGWFRSGDLGRLRSGGDGLVYECRVGDALRLGGFLVNPAEIEEFLGSHPAVDIAQVVGARDHRGREVAVAFVRLGEAGAATDDDLDAWCRQRLAPFKVPARVVLVDEFPTTSGTNGTKIQKAVLRQWAAEQTATS